MPLFSDCPVKQSLTINLLRTKRNATKKKWWKKHWKKNTRVHLNQPGNRICIDFLPIIPMFEVPPPWLYTDARLSHRRSSYMATCCNCAVFCCLKYFESCTSWITARSCLIWWGCVHVTLPKHERDLHTSGTAPQRKSNWDSNRSNASSFYNAIKIHSCV